MSMLDGKPILKLERPTPVFETPLHRPVEIVPLGDSAAVVRFGDSIDRPTNLLVQTLSHFLSQHPLIGSVEFVPAYATVTVYYDPLRRSFEEVATELQQVVSKLETTTDDGPRTIEIPVCYGGEFGPDLEFVAQQNQLTPEEVIEIHSASVYLVYFIGFAPGFPYLGGLSDRITAPRRSSPRLRIPAGSVGIAGTQTGIYPLETPGGWQIIGRTPLALFRPDVTPPTLLQAGDQVRFRPIASLSDGWDRMGNS